MAIVAPPHFKGGSTCQACPAVPTVAQEQQADTRDWDQIKCNLEEPDPALDLLSIMRLLDWEFLNSRDPWFLPNDSSRLVECVLLPKTWRLQIHSCSKRKKTKTTISSLYNTWNPSGSQHLFKSVRLQNRTHKLYTGPLDLHYTLKDFQWWLGVMLLIPKVSSCEDNLRL